MLAASTLRTILGINMNLDEKIKEKIEIKVKKSRDELIQFVVDRKKARNIIANTFYDIDYSEISVQNDQITILRRPGVFTAFRPYGNITIDIFEGLGECNLRFTILPYGGNLSTLLILGSIGLTLWTVLVLLISHGLFGWIFSIGAWAFVAIIQYLGYQYTRTGLLDYSKRLIKDLQ
jgi:hypothetical protein